MATVNVRELARNANKVIDTDALEDWILASSPKVVDGLRSWGR